MNAHVTAEMLGRLARRTLAGAELTTTLRHVGECGICADRAAAALEPEVDAMRNELAAAQESPHIDPETELAAYVNGTLGPVAREIVETHLEDCAMCRAEIDDLMKFARPPARRSAIPLFAAAAAATAVVTTVLLTRRTGVTEPHTPPVAPPVVTASGAPNTPVRSYANAEWDRLVREALRSRRLPMADLTSLEGESDPLRGSTDRAPAALQPAGVVVDDVQPRFTWPPRESATYVVKVFDGDEEVAHSDALTVAEWRPRGALRRGRTYVWQVTVQSAESTTILPAPPAPSAMFRIASQHDHDELAEARRGYPNDHLLHAVLAARAGLRTEAIEALQRSGLDLHRP